MKNEDLNKMWQEIMKLTIGGEKSTRYMKEFMSDEERLAIRKEYLQWCENYAKTNTGGGWSACMSYEYSKDALRDIIEKHVKESVVTLSVDGRKALMNKVMDMAEKLLARFGLDMPAIKWQTYNVSTVKKDKLTLNALDFLYRGANETEDTVIDRCMNLFFAYVYFYGKGVEEWFSDHGMTYTKRTGKDYKAWKKQILASLNEEPKEEKEEEKEEEKTLKKEEFTQENAEKCYNEMQKTANALVKCNLAPSITCDKMLEEQAKYMTTRFDCTEDEALAFLCKKAVTVSAGGENNIGIAGNVTSE